MDMDTEQPQHLNPATHCCGPVDGVASKHIDTCRWCSAEYTDPGSGRCTAPLTEPRKRYHINAEVGELKIPMVRAECRCGRAIVARGDHHAQIVQMIMSGDEVKSLCEGCGAEMITRQSLIETRQARRRVERATQR